MEPRNLKKILRVHDRHVKQMREQSDQDFNKGKRWYLSVTQSRSGDYYVHASTFSVAHPQNGMIFVNAGFEAPSPGTQICWSTYANDAPVFLEHVACLQ